MLQVALAGAGLSAADLDRPAEMTKPASDRNQGYVYSDLPIRIIPAAVLAAYHEHALTFQVLAQIGTNPPTVPFESS